MKELIASMRFVRADEFVCSESCRVNYKENGRPNNAQVLISEQQTLPNFLTSNQFERRPVRKDEKRLKIFSGTANPLLSEEVACYMGLDLGKIDIKRFADGEIYVQLRESVRGCDVYLVQPTCPPANENLMELLIMIDACRRASAKTITAVIPYFGYARADRKYQSDFPTSMKGAVFIDLGIRYKLMAKEILQRQIKLVKHNLMEAIDGADGFQNTHQPKRYESAKFSIDQIEKLNAIIQDVVKEKEEEKERMNGIIAELVMEKEKDKAEKEAMNERMTNIEAMLKVRFQNV